MRPVYKVFAVLLYAAGVLLCAALTLAALLRIGWVPFPQAMLPAPLGELSVGWLAVGTLPMAGATVLLGRACPATVATPARRWLCRLPTLVCAACLVWAVAVCAAGFANTWHALTGG